MWCTLQPHEWVAQFLLSRLSFLHAANWVTDRLHAAAGEEEQVRKLLAHAPLSHTPDRLRYSDPHIKAYALVQAHLSRTHLTADLAADLRTVLPLAVRLLQVRG